MEGKIMKKIIIAIAIVLTMTFGANAQSDWFVSGLDNSGLDNGGSRDFSSEVLPLLVTGGVGAWNDDQPATAPLGSGLLVLTALGAGYAAYKKRR